MTDEPRGKPDGAGSSAVRSSAFRREGPPEGGTTNAPSPPEGGTTNASDRLQPLLAAMLDGQLSSEQIAAPPPAGRRSGRP